MPRRRSAFPARILIYNAGDGVKALINPVILARKGEQTGAAGRLPFDSGLAGAGHVRSAEIRVRGYDQRGKPVTRNAKELEARVIQHEIDHLDGDFVLMNEPTRKRWNGCLSNDDNEDEL